MVGPVEGRDLDFYLEVMCCAVSLPREDGLLRLSRTNFLDGMNLSCERE
jgi:hypothetical protein